LIIAVAGYFFGTDVVNQNLMTQITETIGSETALQIQDVLTKSTAEKSTIWGSIVGVSILLLGATGVFVELQKTLNLIWNVKVKPQNGIWLVIKARLFSFGLILAIAFLLIISLVISTALVAVSNFISFESSQLMMTIYHLATSHFSVIRNDF
jgi:membrane protein